MRPESPFLALKTHRLVRRTQFDLSSRETIRWLEILDQSTQHHVEDILKSLRDGNEEVLSSMEAQTHETERLQTAIQAHVTEEVAKLENVLSQ